MTPLEQQIHEVKLRALHCDPQAYVDKWPDDAIGLGTLISRKMMRCDWRDLDYYIAHLRHLIRAIYQFTEMTFNMIGTTQEEQYVNTTRYVQWKYPNRVRYGNDSKVVRVGNARIKLGYISSDFHEHATCYLLASLFEHHDRAKFEIYAYSCGIEDDSPMRERIKSGVDKFVDMRGFSIEEAAQKIRDDGIDILIDLKGFTSGNCMDIIAQRPAPVIVNYLGFPGTTGGMCDYILADKIVIAEKNRQWFSEAVVYLPGCYQINDDKCEPATPKTREEYGLPATGNVYASFNQAYKITRALWNKWMAFLKTDPGSVLWQYALNSEAMENLRTEAQLRGIDPARIIEAKHVNRADHLARFHTINYFLDTQPVCSHTTGSDAIRMGHFPILADSPTDTMISNVSMSLIANNKTLFDARAKTKQIEKAYEGMMEKYLQGASPEGFSVEE